jgi:hypothetical protein
MTAVATASTKYTPSQTATIPPHLNPPAGWLAGWLCNVTTPRRRRYDTTRYIHTLNASAVETAPSTVPRTRRCFWVLLSCAVYPGYQGPIPRYDTRERTRRRYATNSRYSYRGLSGVREHREGRGKKEGRERTPAHHHHHQPPYEKENEKKNNKRQTCPPFHTSPISPSQHVSLSSSSPSPPSTSTPSPQTRTRTCPNSSSSTTAQLPTQPSTRIPRRSPSRCRYADADPAVDAEGPQTQPKVRRCGWEIMEDGEFPFSLFPFPSPLSLPLPPYSV